MQRLAAWVFWTCLLTLLTAMACRVGWIASRTETGLPTLKQQWSDATIGLVRGSRTAVHSREPIEQADFWLTEVDRVLSNNPGRSELVMGSALVLDSPAPDFMSKYLREIHKMPGGVLLPDFDKEGIERAEDAFESRCRERCLELSTTATELDSANVEWWRLRALLLWRHTVNSYDHSPRGPNWLEILEKGSLHDPDNALYDYLAAYFYWEASAEVDFSGPDERLVVNDAERFKRGVSFFQQGQAKKYFAVGDAGFPAVVQFLSHTKIPLTEHAKIANSRGIHLRRSLLLRGVWRWQWLRADEEVAAGDVRSALATQRQNLRLLEQFTSTGNSTAYDNTSMACRVATAMQMNTLAKTLGEVLSPDEIREIRDIDESARLDENVLQQAALELTAGKPRRAAGVTLTGGPATLVSAIAVSLSASLVVVLLLVGCAAIVLSSLFKTHNSVKVGLIGQSFGIVTACAATIVVFGLAPARIVSKETQAWALTLLVIFTPIALLLWVTWRWLRQRAFKYSLGEMLLSVSVLCILFALVSISRPILESFTTMPFDLAIPTRGWGGWDANSLENALRPLGTWVWAVLQWTAYYGHYLTVAIWAGIVAVLLRLKGSHQRKADRSLLSLRDRMGALFRSLSLPSITLSAIALLIYLVLAPIVVKMVEEDFQSQIAFARRPNDHWTSVEEAVQRVRSDDVMMDQLRQAVEAEMSEMVQEDGL